MFIVISPQNPDPLYKQVMDQIKDAIADGVLKPQERLPSIREIAKELNISEITIKRAYADLEAEGFIYTRAGMGSFVVSIDKERLRKEKLSEIRQDLRRLLRTAERAGLSKQEVVRLLKDVQEE
jgi:GntR family transcriptional regulator